MISGHCGGVWETFMCVLQDTQDLYRIGRKVQSVSLRIKHGIFLESSHSNRSQLR